MGIVIIKHYHTNGKHSNIRLDNVLYVPKASGCFYSTGVATQKGCEARETRLMNKIYSSDGTLLIEGTCKQATGLCYFCQIRIEITDFTGDKISVGSRKTFPHWAISTMWQMTQHLRNKGTIHVHRMRDKGTGFDHRVIASWQLMDNTGIRSIQLMHLLMRSMCSWLITPCAAVSTQYSYKVLG